MLRKLACLPLYVAFACSLLAQAKPNNSDALKLLDEVSKYYATATSYHIESIQESRSFSEFRSSWQKEALRAEQASQNRYRFEGQSFSGSGIVISDGKAEFNLHRTSEQYAKRPPRSFGHPFPNGVVQQDEEPEQKAFSLRSSLAGVGDFAKSAHFLPEETISLATRRVRCFVVSFGPEDLRRPFPTARTTQTYWIDKEHEVIVKSLLVSDGNRFYDSVAVPTHPIPIHTEQLTTYPVMELDNEIPEADFVFTPPDDGVLVEDFPSSLAVRTRANVTVNQYDMIGKLEPALILRAADSSTLQLASLRGHPVLIDLWATWCGSCLSEMPLIDYIFQKTKGIGLVVLGLDYDQDPADAVEFLKRKNYMWADYHADSNSPGFPHNGLPLLVLIDTTGKIVYYHNGSDDQVGLVSAIKQFGPNFAGALADWDVRQR